MVFRSSVSSVGRGAWFNIAMRGSKASCSISAAVFLVFFRYGFVHSMCRWGEFPLVSRWLCWQKGHASRCVVLGMMFAFCVIEKRWCFLYVELHLKARVWDTAV